MQLQKQKPHLFVLNVYCSCRLPFTFEHLQPENVPEGEDTDMIECEICLGWYHRTCLNLSSEEFETLSKPQCVTSKDVLRHLTCLVIQIDISLLYFHCVAIQ